MDNLTYHYTPNTNRLHKVTDAAPDASASDYNKYNDIKQGQADDNYVYDNIGNLIKDNAEGITNIDWTVYGKIASISNASGLTKYAYDSYGNRTLKVTPSDATAYVRDGNGNVLSVYTKPANGVLTQSEIHLYGSSRLGMATTHQVQDVPVVLSCNFGNGVNRTFTRGEKLFELSNHLGNVLATVTDKRIAYPDAVDNAKIGHYDADIASAQDYYPFGMLQPGRKWNAGGYRYGFNGKENDNDVKGEGNQQDYGMRIYDGRIAKFLSVDPITSQYPELTPYQFASNSPIFNIDLDGLEGTSWWNRFLYDPINTLMTGTTWDDLNSVAGDINNLTPSGAVFNGSFQAFTGRNPVTLQPGASRIDGIGQATIGAIFHYSTVRATTIPAKSAAALEKQMAVNAPAVKATGKSTGAAARKGASSEAKSTASELPKTDALDIPDLNPTRLSGTGTNCAGCAVAGDHALKGNQNLVYAFNHGIVDTDMFMKFFSADKWEKFKRAESIMFKMRNLKEGATGVIFGDRGAGEIGHYFNVVKKNGMVMFVDFQEEIGERVLNPNTLMKNGGYIELWFINTTPK